MRQARSRGMQRGYTLVEVVGVMAGLAVVMGVSLVALRALHGADHRFARRMETQDFVDQLARQVRRDAHAAMSATWDAERRELEFALPGGSVVVYRWVGDRWERRRRAAAQAEDGEADDSLDGAFRLPEGAGCAVEVVDGARLDLVRVTVSPLPVADTRDASRSMPLPLEIVAAIGADRELVTP
jgi:hypothetical protein